MSDASNSGRALVAGSWRETPRVVSVPPRTPGPGELVVRVRAVAVNPIERLNGPGRRLVLPWLRYPAVLGTDVAGEVVAVGSGGTRFAVGDRVLGHAAGTERSRNRPEEGAFQTHAVLLERVTAPIADALPFEQAAVLPLALSTAAAGLFEPDQLALPLPAADTSPNGEVVVVWGGSTSVGMNAIQLARGGGGGSAAGYAVLATASPRNAALLEQLGAEAVVDYRDGEAIDRLVTRIGNRDLAGVVAIGRGSLSRAVRLTRRTSGSRRIASAYPTPPTRLRAMIERRRGIRISAIWGGSPVDSAVGPAIYADFLPGALADGRFVAAPPAMITGSGLEAIPAALTRLGQGVSAQKVVVTDI